eukprot:248658-Karenia_brevis.AAC.1
MESERLLNEMRTFSMERQGECQDLWSPIDMLNRNNFAFLTDDQIGVVVGVEDSVAGNDDDYKMGLRMIDGSYKYLVVDQCRSKMVALLNDFQGVFQSMGGTRWATEAD